MGKTRQIPPWFDGTVFHLKPLSIRCVVIMVSNGQIPGTSKYILYWTSSPTRVNGLCWDRCIRPSTSHWTTHQKGIRLQLCTRCPRSRQWSRICCGSKTRPRQLRPPPGQNARIIIIWYNKPGLLGRSPNLRWQQSGSRFDQRAPTEQWVYLDKYLRNSAFYILCAALL